MKPIVPQESGRATHITGPSHHGLHTGYDTDPNITNMNQPTDKAVAAGQRRSSSPSVDRSSFSSIRENHSELLAQAFTSSKKSSYVTQDPDEAIDDSSDTAESEPQAQAEDAPGEALIEGLPFEILSAVASHLVLDIPPGGMTHRNMDLMNLLCTSKTIHSVARDTLHQQITIPHSKIFKKFLARIATPTSSDLGAFARRLDFSHFNPSILFSTAIERSRTQNLTSETLLQCLELTPNVLEFLAQEHIEDDLDGNVLRKLFFGLHRMKALDFCGCSSTDFKNAFSSTFSTALSADLATLERLSLHKCATIPSTVFDTLLPRLPRLTHLDLAGTRIQDSALASIPTTARLTHLNLAKCHLLTAESVINFISTHPAVVESLVWLSLSMDARTHELLDAESVSRLLPVLPSSLKSLSLKGSKMEPSHIRLLLPLTKHLEELALGRSLSLMDLNAMFIPDEDSPEADEQDVDGEDVDEWVPHTLRYIDLSDMWTCTELGVPTLFDPSCALLQKQYTVPLEVVEISEDVAKRLRRSETSLTKLGWQIKEMGARNWLVRNKSELRAISGASIVDDGCRPWKMGAESWGMRKIPVARADVGGVYGSYMFARKL